LNEVPEPISLLQELGLRLDEHFLPKCLKHDLSDVPIEDVQDASLLLGVELVRLPKVIDQVGFVNNFIAFCFVKLSCLLDKLFV
jgi:hypothetical protein